MSEQSVETRDRHAGVRIRIRPRQIRLEASTVCQLQCPSCPTASGQVRQALGAGFLRFQDFRRIVGENSRLAHIELANWGEVFLNPELLPILRYAYQHNVALSIGTGANLNTVSDEVLEAVARYRVRLVTCSIDGASQETYAQYRRHGHFEQVIQNIRTINRFKRQYRSPYPRLKWQFVAFGHNEHEIGRARRLAQDLGMTFWVKLSWGDLYGEGVSPIRDPELIRRETGLGVASRREYAEKYGRAYLSCCGELWTCPQINYDGRLLGCCVNYWADYGNVFHEGLEACVNNERIGAARAMLLGRRAATEDIPCARCRIYREREEHQDWLTAEDIQDSPVPSRRRILLTDKILGPRVMRSLSWCRARVQQRRKKAFLRGRA